MKALNRHVIELAGLRSLDNFNKTDINWSSMESEEMEAALRSVVEAFSWMDWWAYAMKSLLLKSTNDASFVCRLSLAGARCQLLVAKTSSTLWANIVLKRQDAVLAKVKDSMSFEYFIDLRNAKVSSGSELFPADVLEKAVKKSLKVLHNEAIRKAVSRDKPASHGKKLHFSTTRHQQQRSQQQQSKNPAGSSVGSSFRSSSLTSSSCIASSSSSRRGRGKKF